MRIAIFDEAAVAVKVRSDPGVRARAVRRFTGERTESFAGKVKESVGRLRKGDYRSTQTGPSDPRSYHRAMGATTGPTSREISDPLGLLQACGTFKGPPQCPWRRPQNRPFRTRHGALVWEVTSTLLPRHCRYHEAGAVRR